MRKLWIESDMQRTGVEHVDRISCAEKFRCRIKIRIRIRIAKRDIIDRWHCYRFDVAAIIFIIE